MPDLTDMFPLFKNFYLFLILAPVLVALTIFFGNRVMDYLDRRHKQKQESEKKFETLS